MRRKKIKMDASMKRMFQKQRRLFIQKFGREPGPNDPVFFDPNHKTPVAISEKKIEDDIRAACIKAGIDITRFEGESLWDVLMRSARAYPDITEQWLAEWDEET